MGTFSCSRLTSSPCSEQPSKRDGASSHSIRYYQLSDILVSKRKNRPLISSWRTSLCPDTASGKLHVHSPFLSYKLCREQSLNNVNFSTSSHHSCPTCYPNFSVIRASDATGIDPNSALAKRRAYSARPKGKSDSLPRELREYFLYKSQSYTWRRMRLMREIKAYLALDVPVKPDYGMGWSKDLPPCLQREQVTQPPGDCKAIKGSVIVSKMDLNPDFPNSSKTNEDCDMQSRNI